MTRAELAATHCRSCDALIVYDRGGAPEYACWGCAAEIEREERRLMDEYDARGRAEVEQKP